MIIFLQDSSNVKFVEGFWLENQDTNDMLGYPTATIGIFATTPVVRFRPSFTAAW